MIQLQSVDENDGIFESGNDDDEEEEGGSGHIILGELLDKLTTRIIQADMEDFELVKMLLCIHFF